MKKYQYAALISCLVVIFCLSGCKRTGLSGLVPCSGTVIQNGQPQAEVDMTFVPVSAGEGVRGASARTDEKGAFKVTTLEPGDGIFPGEYKLKLTKRTPDKVYTQAEEEAARVQNKSLPITYIEQMGKYADPDKSGLTVTIPKGGEKNLEIKID
ncbi:MAG: hypothetical protein LBQ54_16645 [Planctomycetaceae bacterium]|jgi:hypothetical protein|nr:hypothetical protein [Planctomycetaceae bacterium]